MKRQIRTGVFETNSSSTHSVAVGKNVKGVVRSRRDIYVDRDENIAYGYFGQFGWGYKAYAGAEAKLSYALTMVLQTEARPYEGFKEEDMNTPAEEYFYSLRGFKQIEEVIKDELGCDGLKLDLNECPLDWDSYDWGDGDKRIYLDSDGYIDHQSCEDYSNLDEFINRYGISLRDFIFDTDIVLILDNDNDPHKEFYT